MTQEPTGYTDAAEQALSDAWESWERLEPEHHDMTLAAQEFNAAALYAIARALIEIVHQRRPRGGFVLERPDTGYLGRDVLDDIEKRAEELKAEDPNQEIQALLEYTDIVALIGEYVDLKHTGTDHRGPCPFHGGKHRNFAVIPKQQIYYCYVCHESGTAVDFLMKKHKLSKSDALQKLRERRDGIDAMEPVDHD